jgi:hypothetical protein
MESLCVPASIERIGWFCFFNCPNLSSVTVGPEWTVFRPDDLAFPVVCRSPDLASSLEVPGRLYFPLSPGGA